MIWAKIVLFLYFPFFPSFFLLDVSNCAWICECMCVWERVCLRERERENKRVFAIYISKIFWNRVHNYIMLSNFINIHGVQKLLFDIIRHIYTFTHLHICRFSFLADAFSILKSNIPYENVILVTVFLPWLSKTTLFWPWWLWKRMQFLHE